MKLIIIERHHYNTSITLKQCNKNLQDMQIPVAYHTMNITVITFDIIKKVK